MHFNDFERAVVKAITEVVRHTGGPASTLAVASRVYLSDRQARRYLVRLEQSRQVQRVGQRGGWLLAA